MYAKHHWQNWLTAIVGIWLMISPWILNLGMTISVGNIEHSLVTGNLLLCGAFALFIALASVLAHRPWEDWVEAALGLWLILSPLVLRYSDNRPAVWSAVLSGALIMIAAGSHLFEDRPAHPAR
ncbi:SPW repeat protein [Pararhizobium haloflavum]|uniref:SPW repeat protein n=1 Tax=Pararhizobium haloflavum TaxID=2037914 RepID=UPI0012FFE3A5|nr:SPW repeat protein [Pararhizobium haloflavum]